jgi:hypothetical protein
MAARPPGERAELGATPGIHRNEIVVYRANTAAVFLRFTLRQVKIQLASGF